MILTITPLGTVSPYCKEEHNCPGFLINYKDYKILLDCGNGITRYVNFPVDLNNLSVVITHYHIDHYGDIGALQYASFVYHNLGKIGKKINIYLPKEDINYRKKAICQNNEAYSLYHDINEKSPIYLSDLKITFKNNQSHSIPSYMVKLETNEFKAVYTSDIGTTNWQELIKFCKNADILISESSFLKSHNSLSKTHLTAYDAGSLAKECNASKLLLTHLWPEEIRENYLAEAQKAFSNTELALENKKIILKKNK